MKKLFAIIGVAALLATVSSAVAQESGYPLMPASISLPAVIKSGIDPTNFATPVVIDLKKSYVTTVSFTLSAPVATHATFTGAWSSDGVTYDTNNIVTFTALVGAVNATATCTNILTRNGRRYFEILSETGAKYGNITNNSASYGLISSPW